MTQLATFAAGCFWGVEQWLGQMPGVVRTTVGYIGGHVESPGYKQVCTDTTGHAEAVEVEFNPELVSYPDLLAEFWRIHNPTELNRQGPDVGSQYRTAIFYHSDEQRQQAEASRAEFQPRFSRPIVTQIVPAGTFWTAEEYHQKYFEKRGVDGCHRPNWPKQS